MSSHAAHYLAGKLNLNMCDGVRGCMLNTQYRVCKSNRGFVEFLPDADTHHTWSLAQEGDTSVLRSHHIGCFYSAPTHCLLPTAHRHATVKKNYSYFLTAGTRVPALDTVLSQVTGTFIGACCAEELWLVRRMMSSLSLCSSSGQMSRCKAWFCQIIHLAGTGKSEPPW